MYPGSGSWKPNIYELAGETFNINSPKQLGVILFESFGFLMAKKQRPDTLRRQSAGKAAYGRSYCQRYFGVPSADKAKVHLCGWPGRFIFRTMAVSTESSIRPLQPPGGSAARNPTFRIFPSAWSWDV